MYNYTKSDQIIAENEILGDDQDQSITQPNLILFKYTHSALSLLVGV